MESNIETTVKTTLILNENEKEWLKGLMQNPVAAHETEIDSAMRRKFWDALSN